MRQHKNTEALAIFLAWRILALSKLWTTAIWLRTIMRRSLSFEAWKELLRNDCFVVNKVEAFDTLGEGVLRVLYENGVDPTVQSILANGLNGKPSPMES